MEIKKVIPSGYCNGVISAIKTCIETRNKYPDEDIAVLGMIVHNQYVVDALAKYNIRTLIGDTYENLINSLDKGIIIFSAHGISDRYKELAVKRGLTYVDASCKDVIKTRNNCLSKLEQGYKIIYIGKKNHPEANAIIDISSDIHLISDINEVDDLEIDGEKIYITNQTTLSLFDTQKIYDRLLERYPEAEIDNEICNATTIRQQAIMKLKDEDIDLLYIVGDPKSNNTASLEKIALESNIKKVLRIENHLGLREEDLRNAQRIRVTSGASTPTYLTDMVIDAIRFYEQNHYLEKRPLDMGRII